MEERDKRRIGEELEPGGRPKAPGRLELLQRFINSHNHDFPADWDRIGTPDKARAWLLEKGLVAPGDRVSQADVARLRELREALRELVVANQGTRPGCGAGGRPQQGRRQAELIVAVDDSGLTTPRSRPAAASTAPWRRSSASSTRPSSAATGRA